VLAFRSASRRSGLGGVQRDRGGAVADAVGTIGLFENIRSVKPRWWICARRRSRRSGACRTACAHRHGGRTPISSARCASHRAANAAARGAGVAAGGKPAHRAPRGSRPG